MRWGSRAPSWDCATKPGSQLGQGAEGQVLTGVDGTKTRVQVSSRGMRNLRGLVKKRGEEAGMGGGSSRVWLLPGGPAPKLSSASAVPSLSGTRDQPVLL